VPEPRLLVVMGSGETAPTMVTTHQRVFGRLGPDPRAVLLDTPYGFQANADDLTARATAYFAQSVGRPVHAARFRSKAEAAADPVAHEHALDDLRGADWAFAGPGSPSYALRTWAGTPVPGILAEMLARRGAVTFASAAALTIGVATVPVYEVYKVGEEPRWLDGLDLLGAAAGLTCALIPHYDNAEGGTHDTRFCYLGEPRLAALEADLPAGAFVLGVDEHTALILDLEAGTASVTGRGTVTVRLAGRSTVLPTGTEITIDHLRALGEGREDGEAGVTSTASPAVDVPVPEPVVPSSLAASTAEAQTSFDAAIEARDATAAVAAALALEEAIAAWGADTLQSDEMDRARAALRGMLTRLGRVATEGLVDRRDIVGPFVDALLTLRAQARDAKRWSEADAVRDALASAGVEARDTPAGVEWELRQPGSAPS
jgi:hypothetical protein